MFTFSTLNAASSSAQKSQRLALFARTTSIFDTLRLAPYGGVSSEIAQVGVSDSPKIARLRIGSEPNTTDATSAEHRANLTRHDPQPCDFR